MAVTYAFDVYGTLVNTSIIQEALVRLVGDNASQLMDAWRSKQLEYSFRRGLMNRHIDFSVCTRQALIYCCQYYNIILTEAEENRIMEAYRALPAFPEVPAVLRDLKEKNIPFYAFSNGSSSAVKHLLENASILDLFTGIVSTEAVQNFKPSPLVYHHFLEITNTSLPDACLVSGNSFDILGAKSAGLKTVWVKRNAHQFIDPWGTAPDRVIHDLGELQEVFI